MQWDTRSIWDLKRALWVAHELEAMDVFWFEEPLSHWNSENMRILRKETRFRIAGGEMNHRRHDFRQMAENECLDVYQPDVALSGGITWGRKIADLIQMHGFASYTWTNGIGLLANLHVAAAGVCPYVEFPAPPSWSVERRDFLLATPLSIDQKGFLHVPNRPGLGIELDGRRPFV